VQASALVTDHVNFNSTLHEKELEAEVVLGHLNEQKKIALQTI
jgi:hypothetical protein